MNKKKPGKTITMQLDPVLEELLSRQAAAHGRTIEEELQAIADKALRDKASAGQSDNTGTLQ